MILPTRRPRPKPTPRRHYRPPPPPPPIQERLTSWHDSARNAVFENNVLQAELLDMQGNWIFNKLEIHPLLLNKPLINDNGIFKYTLTREEDDEIMKSLLPVYDGPTLPYIHIKQCVMLSVDLPKYNGIRSETLQVLNQYKLPPIHVHYGRTPATVKSSPFYDCIDLTRPINRVENTVGFLEIFDNFANQHNDGDWLLLFEDDVRPVNVSLEEDLTKLYNVPVDAEMIRPYIGKNEHCALTDITYNVSYGGGNNHAIYVSVAGCKKIVNYARTYKWKYDGDIDMYKIAKHCRCFPTGLDGWGLNSTRGKNDVVLEEDGKLSTYQMSYVIFNQTSAPCV